MSADEDLNQRVQVAQQRMVDRVPPDAQTGDPVQEPPQKKVRFEEQVEEQTSEGPQYHSTPIPQNPSSRSTSSNSTTRPTSTQVDESDQDCSKRQRILLKTHMELEGLDKNCFSNIARRDKLRGRICCSKVSVHQFALQKCSQILDKCVLSADLVSLLDWRPDLRTGWDLDDLAHRANVWSLLQQERPILIVGNWSGVGTRMTHTRWMIDIHHWQVSQGLFFVHEQSRMMSVHVELCAMKSVLVSGVDRWKSFLTNCEEAHNNLSKLSLSVADHCVLAMVRGLRQALTRIVVCRR